MMSSLEMPRNNSSMNLNHIQPKLILAELLVPVGISEQTSLCATKMTVVVVANTEW